MFRFLAQGPALGAKSSDGARVWHVVHGPGTTRNARATADAPFVACRCCPAHPERTPVCRVRPVRPSAHRQSRISRPRSAPGVWAVGHGVQIAGGEALVPERV